MSSPLRHLGRLAALVPCAMLAAPLGSGGSAAAETLLLDTRGPAVTTAGALDAQTWYQITVTGTYSAWTAATWGVPCGTTEAEPQTPSSGVSNGPVGLDAEVWFAAAMCGATDPLCCCNTPCPHHYAYFWMNLDGTWNHIEPIDGPHDVPTEGHVYVYRVLGQGRPASFVNYDDVYADNYGVLTIAIEPLVTGVQASEASGGSLILRAPSPNPTSGPTLVSFWLQAEAPATLIVYDVAGRRVHQAEWPSLSPGEHSVTWSGTTPAGAAAPAGIYFIRLSSLGISRTQRVAVVR